MNEELKHQVFMQRAMQLARRGEGRVEPNPMVGCVIVKKGQIIGEGYHRRFGGPHAEIQALRSCNTSPRGATLYCTLEPCMHFGKTPPCVNAIIEAKVARVVAAILDPNPKVHGKGVRLLKKAGIEVLVSVLAEEAAELIRPFATRMLLRRPYVIAKWAQSFNGLLVPGPGESRWISGPVSRRKVHRLRARMDAIMVGAGTVAADDPLLTARDVPVRRVAKRLVVDGRLRISTSCRLVQTADKIPTFIFTSRSAVQSKKAAALRREGVEVVAMASRRGKLSLKAILDSPQLVDITNLLVEGGPTLLNEFFHEGLVDEAHIYVAPRAIKGNARTSQRVGFGLASPISIGSQRSGKDRLFRLLYPTHF